MRYASSYSLSNQGVSTIIPAKQFVSDVTYQDFMMYRCISESKFLNALRTIKIDNNKTLADNIKTAQDVRKLAYYADSGIGFQKWNVDLKKLLGSIKFDDNEINKAECQIGFSKD